ncbi:MAG TPA: endo-1,4-beta-xylanase [Steroidobacteraceae bacterium]|nr:endo-1,4-beta-xylanase [Steroidobacteraceae bacterium]
MNRGWTRRALLAAAGSGAGLACAPAFATSIVMPSLNALAREKGFVFGSALSMRGLQDEPYKQLLREQCGVLVAENEFKMPAIEPAPGEFKFERADLLLDFAESASLKMRGHTLLWHHPRWLPRWIDTVDLGADPARGAEQLLVTHVRTTANHFGKRIASWDVVNEAVDNLTGEMRATRLSQSIGSADAVLELAFRTARDALPDTELVYNDYMGWEKDNAPHRDGVLKLLERLRRRGVPVNALGIQGHIGAGNQDSNANRAFDARDERAWRAFLKEVTGMGYSLLVTELDVHDAPLTGSVKQRDAQVAALGRAFLDVTLSFREVNAVLCWGLADKYTWLNGRTPRADGQPKRPTPFDARLAAKPLFHSMAAAFRAAPSRTHANITGRVA